MWRAVLHRSAAVITFVIDPRGCSLNRSDMGGASLGCRAVIVFFVLKMKNGPLLGADHLKGSRPTAFTVLHGLDVEACEREPGGCK